MKLKSSPALDTAKLCCRILDEKKADALAVLDVSEQSSITDYLVIATATSEPHLRALRNEVEKVLDDAGVRLVGAERSQESGWLVIDAFDVMIHLFLGPTRERFGLERLWRDSTEVNVSKLLAPPAKRTTPARTKAPARRTQKKRK